MADVTQRMSGGPVIDADRRVARGRHPSHLARVLAFPRRLGSFAALLFVTLALVACSDSVPPATVEVRVITPTSTNPFEGEPITRVTLEVQQGDAEPVRRVDDVTDDFDLGVAIPDLTLRTRTRVVLEGADGILLHGAAPPFVPLASGGLVRIVVGPPGRCAVVGRAQLLVGRANRGHALVDTFAVFVAGLDEAGATSNGVTSLDLLRFDTVDDRSTAGALPALAGLRGPARAAAFGVSRLAIVGGDASIRYDLGVFEGREAPLALHAGADLTSALGSVGNAAIVAGGASASATWITTEERLVAISLDAARADGALVEVGGAALFSGGATEDGVPIAELLRADGTSVAIESAMEDGTRRHGRFVVASDALLLVGGLDDEGTLRSDTLLFRGCPEACVASEGPPWSEPREGLATSGDLLVAGDRVERFTGEAIVPYATLAVPRHDPLVARLESGVLLVAGGEPALRDVELCFPETLDPL